MACIHRLAVVLFAALVMALTSPVFAKTVWSWGGTDLYAPTAQFPSVAEACAAIISSVVATGRHSGGQLLSVHDNYCDFHFDTGKVGGGNASFGVGATTLPDDPPPPPACRPPMLVNPVTGNCDVTEDSAACDAFAALSKSTLGNVTNQVEIKGVFTGGTACVASSGVSPGNGCKVEFQRDVQIGVGATARTLGTYVPKGGDGSDPSGLACAISSGSTPGSGTSTIPTITPANCKGSYGTVNGVATCVPLNSTVAPTTVSKTKTVQTTTPTGDASTVDTVDTTVCQNGRCTTTTSTTTTVNNSKVTGSSTVGELQGDFCQKNPKAVMCSTATEKDSSFGGACLSGFTCEGDAVQCAIAKEVYVQNCKLNAPTDQSSLFDSERKRSGNLTSDLPGNSNVTLSAASFDQSNALGAGASCIQDLSVTVMGRPLLLPFSMVCPGLENLGAVLLAVSFLLAARIVIRG